MAPLSPMIANGDLVTSRTVGEPWTFGYPQDVHGDGRDWKFETSEHGGDEPDNMPQAIAATDPAGRWAIYVPLTRGGKIVIPRPYSETVADLPRD